MFVSVSLWQVKQSLFVTSSRPFAAAGSLISVFVLLLSAPGVSFVPELLQLAKNRTEEKMIKNFMQNI
jgi:hypothetical protein